jgi:uncharacterized protein (TIGR03435 family)
MKVFGTGVCLLMLVSHAAGQSDTRPEFEVASIKPASPFARNVFIVPGPGGGVSLNNFTLKEMIVLGWRVQPFQISGGPPWLDSVHYDVVAKPETKPKQDEIPLMLQALLADRFQLVIHHDTKELPLFALTLARKDGKLGPKLIPHEGACTALDPPERLPPSEPGKRPVLPCGAMQIGARTLIAVGVPIASVAPLLARILGSTVIDKTGLTGNFDLRAEWTLDENQALAFLLPGTPPPPPSDTAGPSIFTAMQEQLGLKLISQKGPVEILVIDRAEKPSEN